LKDLTLLREKDFITVFPDNNFFNGKKYKNINKFIAQKTLINIINSVVKLVVGITVSSILA
jgi:hypothetical protein